MAKVILDEGLYNRPFLENWVNWEEYLKKVHPGTELVFENFIEKMKEEYAEFTPEFAAQESGVKGRR
jgi:anaerobic selenocysteine-containing dehydrogenase